MAEMNGGEVEGAWLKKKRGVTLLRVGHMVDRAEKRAMLMSSVGRLRRCKPSNNNGVVMGC